MWPEALIVPAAGGGGEISGRDRPFGKATTLAAIDNA